MRDHGGPGDMVKDASNSNGGPETPDLSGADWRVVDLLPDPVLLLDRDWVILRANAATLRRLDVERLEGESVLQALPMLPRTPFERRVREAMTAGRSVSFTTRYA